MTLTYTDGAGGAERESRFNWEVVDASEVRGLLSGMDAGAANPIPDEAEAEAATVATPTAPSSNSTGWGIDWKTVLLQRARRAIFDAPAVKIEQAMSTYRAREGGGPAAAARAAVESTGPGTGPAAAAAAVAGPQNPGANVSLFPDVYPRFGPVDTPSGKFGYVRLQTFAPESGDLDGAVAEFARILRMLPPDGLILDVRGNGGGFINFGERILQMLTPRPITPEPFHFVATAMTQEITGRNTDLSRWADPIKLGIATGSAFSQGFPLTAPEACNDVGQVYQGPVVLVTDALCYSTTDIFAAGFQDHAVGTILGTHKATGAGGANVWNHAYLVGLTFEKQNPFVSLPQGAQMRVAARRLTRLGERSGVPVEDLGVNPDGLYFMTLDDVLLHNKDLIAHAASILKKMEKQSLDLTAAAVPPVARLEARSRNVDRVDVLVDGRPVLTQDVAAGSGNQTLTLPSPAESGSTITVNGYRAGTLVVSRRLSAS